MSAVSRRPRILSLGFAVPPRSYDQGTLYDALGYTRAASRLVFTQNGIKKRHLWMLPPGKSWQELCDAYAAGALALGVESARNCLDGTDPGKIALIVFCSVTGLTVPAMSYHIMRALHLRGDVMHTNILGQGCEASVPGLKRACDFIVAASEPRLALVITTEICSATYYPAPETDVENLVANAIFADGSSCALVGFDNDPRHPEVIGFETACDQRYLGLLGYRWQEGRLKVVLSREVPEVVPGLVKKAVDRLLGRYGLGIADVAHWLIHPGGARILENVECALGLAHDQLACSWQAYHDYGNCSSATLGIVAKLARRGRLKGYIMAVTMGAGVAVDAVLLHSQE